MADTQSGCAKAPLTTVVVLLGAIVGLAIGGLSGFVFGGVLGYVLLRQADLGRRLKGVEEAQRWTKGFSTSEPPAPLSPPLVPPPSPPASGLARPPAAPPPAASPPAAPPPPVRETVPFETASVAEPVARVAQPPAPPTAPLHEPTAQRAGDRNVQAAPSLVKTWVTTGNVPSRPECWCRWLDWVS